MLCREIISFFPEIHAKHICTAWTEFRIVECGALWYIVTSGIQVLYLCICIPNLVFIFCIHTLTKLDSNQISFYTPSQWFKLLQYTPTPFCNTAFRIRHEVTTLHNEVHTLRALFLFNISVPWLWPYRCLLGNRYSKISLDILAFLTVGYSY
jgi:hypothetical protein